MANTHPAARTIHSALTDSPRDHASVAIDAAPRPDTPLQPSTRQRFFGEEGTEAVAMLMGTGVCQTWRFAPISASAPILSRNGRTPGAARWLPCARRPPTLRPPAVRPPSMQLSNQHVLITGG